MSRTPHIDSYFLPLQTSPSLSRPYLPAPTSLPYTSPYNLPLKPLQVRSPLFQDQPRLPTPLGSFIYTAPYFTDLSLADRLTALPLLGPLLEYASDQDAYDAYDKMSALELFRYGNRMDCMGGLPLTQRSGRLGLVLHVWW